MKQILLLEDDVTLGNGIRLALQNDTQQITLCRTLAEGRAAWEQGQFDLLVLDVNLPDGSGLELLHQVRQASSIPVILLTANDMEMDIVTGLESGADDYMVKPIELDELVLRIEALLRRANIEMERKLTIGNLTLDADAMSAEIDGEEVKNRRCNINHLEPIME